MIAIIPISRHYYWATLFVGTEQIHFKYALEENKTEQTSAPLQNVMSKQKRLAIQTAWNLPFKANMSVEVEGELYKIAVCQELENRLNECANRMWKPHNTFWHLELIR